MAGFLLESGADVESRDLEGRTPLHVTAWQGHAPMVAVLLDSQAHVDATDRYLCILLLIIMIEG